MSPVRRTVHHLPGLLLISLLLVSHAGCDDRASSGPGRSTITIFAAASLTEPLGAIEAEFENAHPDIDIRLNLAGSHTLATQILHGAPVDLFISADARQAERLAGMGQFDPARVLLHNELVIAVAERAAGRITTISDLAEPGWRLVLGAEAAPIGAYARAALERAGLLDAVMANVVSLEPDVKSVLAKVTSSAADAGIVYRSDVVGLDDAVTSFPLPEDMQVRAEYVLLARISSAPAGSAAASFIEFLDGERARTIFTNAGFEVPP